jgi:NADH:ubiquinone oxidoreductase subunit C
MITIECYLEKNSNGRPAAFSLMGHPYKVKEIIDTWHAKVAVYYKIKAQDDNIYLLKYDERQAQWDLVFFQNPKKLDILLPPDSWVNSLQHPLHEDFGLNGKEVIN